ncbi:hypothetical protein TRVL_05295 [Trypanosoma vivax]|nr:hypothetical protein TRVL_05295 [Trypanosoma vivax]
MTSVGHNNDDISNELALAGIKREVIRVFPFWKVFVELREAYRRKPELVSCEISVLARVPCQHFAGVDLLWVQSDIVVTNKKIIRRDRKMNKVECQVDKLQSKFCSMHFVHRNAHRAGDAGSYNLQSVLSLDMPEQMQCVAGNILHFTLLVHGMLRHAQCGDHSNSSFTILPSPFSAIVIIGMGGNSIGCGLRHILGSEANIHLVEIEPAVVQVCKTVGLVKEEKNTHIHLGSAEEALHKCPINCTIIFMDAFEPIGGHMVNTMNIIKSAFDHLEADGLLVINEHSIPNEEQLAPLLQIFGNHNVQYINIRGCEESVIVATKPGGKLDGLGSQCSKRLANKILSIFDSTHPRWMPNYMWIKQSRAICVQKEPTPMYARQWTS